MSADRAYGINWDLYRGIAANWDGYGAKPPRPEAIEAAQMLTELLSYYAWTKPAVVPVNNGNIQLEWHCSVTSNLGATMVDLEVEVKGPTYVEVYLDRGGKELTVTMDGENAATVVVAVLLHSLSAPL